MRKQKHPYRLETLIQLKDGSVYWKRWLYFRPTLSLDLDTTVHSRWKKIFVSVIKKSQTLIK